MQTENNALVLAGLGLAGCFIGLGLLAVGTIAAVAAQDDQYVQLQADY